MNKKLILLSAAALIACAPLQPVFSAYPSTEAYDSKPVGKIDIQMENLPPDASFDPKPVRAKMNTKIGDPFSQLAFDGDLKTLSEEYDRIEPSIEVVNGEVYITLRVWARPTIDAIEWTGNAHISSSTLKKELGIKRGKVFNRIEFNKAFNKVKEYYVKKGYFESQLSYTLETDPKTNKVKVHVRVIEGRAGIVDDIVFQGFTSSEKSEILDMIYTKKYNFFTSWLTGQGILNEEAVEQDKLTIANLLQNKGYADAKVDIQVKEIQGKDKISLVISADRGPLFHFGTVTFSGNTLFPDDDIEKRFEARPKGVYSPDALRNSQQAIKDLYGRKGYIDTSVQYETKLEGDDPVYDVHFTIEEGSQYKIGLIRIFGNVQTETHVILRESLLVPGETFDSLKLKKTQERLEKVGYFKTVNVYAVRTQDDLALGDNYRDVYIEVDEGMTGNMSLFFGLSSGEGIFGGLDLTETNFNYKGFGRLFKDGPSALRGGGEYAHAKITLGSKQRNYTAAWLTPYFRDTLWRVGFDVFLSQSKLVAKDYEIDSFGGSVYASYPLNAYWSYGNRYRFKHAKIDVSHGAPQKERRDGGVGNVSAIAASLKFDSTDDIMKPHNGFRSGMEAEFAGIGGTFSFMKYNYANAYYQQLWRRGIMKYRWDAMFIQPILWTKKPDDIPLSERFFIGGENTVRGYKPYNIGEHFPKSHDPMGGTTAAILSVEYLQEVFSLMDIFFFIDAGSIKLKTFEFSQLKMSYGAGVRLEVMNRMPIILGYGVPINADKREKQPFFFSMGGAF